MILEFTGWFIKVPELCSPSGITYVLKPKSSTSFWHENKIKIKISSKRFIINLKLIKDVLQKIWQQEIGRNIADMGLAIMEGSPEKIADVKRLVEKSEEGFVPDDDVEPVTTDLDTLLEFTKNEDCWHFNIPSLSKVVRGGKAGEFMITFARPEIG